MEQSSPWVTNVQLTDGAGLYVNEGCSTPLYHTSLANKKLKNNEKQALFCVLSINTSDVNHSVLFNMFKYGSSTCMKKSLYPHSY